MARICEKGRPMQRALNICSWVGRDSLHLSLPSDVFIKKLVIKSTSFNVDLMANREWKRNGSVRLSSWFFDRLANDKSDAMLRMDAIKAIVFLDKLRFYAIRDVLFAFSCRHDRSKNERRKKSEYTGEKQAEKVLRTTAGTVALLPFDLRSKTRRRECAQAFLPLKLCRRLKEDRSFVSLI